MIGIAVKRGAGGGNNVSTIYGSSFHATLDAGFTTSGSGSGSKFIAYPKTDDGRGFEQLYEVYLAASSDGVSTSIQFLSYNNTLLTLTFYQVIADIKQLSGNYYNAINHTY